MNCPHFEDSAMFTPIKLAPFKILIVVDATKVECKTPKSVNSLVDVFEIVDEVKSACSFALANEAVLHSGSNPIYVIHKDHLFDYMESRKFSMSHIHIQGLTTIDTKWQRKALELQQSLMDDRGAAKPILELGILNDN